jgi:ribosome maturation factor RimP
MDLRQRIEQFVADSLDNPSYFVVEVTISTGKTQPKVMILLDGDEGITIEACARISRLVGEFLESGDLISTSYILEVSSPGIDYPLSMRRQYTKNIGRSVKVITPDGKELKGELVAAGETSFTIQPPQKKKKGELQEAITLAYNEVKSTKVLVSFK